MAVITVGLPPRPASIPAPLTDLTRAVAATSNVTTLRLANRDRPWFERQADRRRLVGGCPDHWWSPTARTSAACTCDRS
jgi:hypothetical protein